MTIKDSEDFFETQCISDKQLRTQTEPNPRTLRTHHTKPELPSVAQSTKLKYSIFLLKLSKGQIHINLDG